MAALVAGDQDAVAALLHGDLVYVHSHGAADDRASYLAALAAGTWSYDAIDHQIEVDLVDGRTALVTGLMRARGSAGGRAVELVSSTLSVWVCDQRGQWLLRAFQSTAARR